MAITPVALLLNGVGPLTLSLLGTAVPPGLAIDLSSGILSGTPIAHGSYSFSLAYADTRVPAPNMSVTTFSLTVALSGQVVITTDFASPLVSACLLRGQAAAAADDLGSFLRLTDGTANGFGSAEYRAPLDATAGLDIRFVQAQYGGTGSEGLVVYLRDGSSMSTDMGSTGGGLGYAPDFGASPVQGGMPDALVAVALSASGSFSSDSRFSGEGCSSDGSVSANLLSGPGSVVVRGGPLDSNTSRGYCIVGSRSLGSIFLSDTNPASRSARSRAVRVLLDPPAAGSSRMLRVLMTPTGSFVGCTEVLAVNISASASLAGLAAASSVYLGVAAASGSGANAVTVTNLEVASIDSNTRASRAAGTTWYQDVFPTGWLTTSSIVWRTGGSSAALAQSSDSEGSFLLLTTSTSLNSQVGFMEMRSWLPLSHGIDIRFVQAQVSRAAQAAPPATLSRLVPSLASRLAACTLLRARLNQSNGRHDPWSLPLILGLCLSCTPFAFLFPSLRSAVCRFGRPRYVDVPAGWRLCVDESCQQHFFRHAWILAVRARWWPQ